MARRVHREFTCCRKAGGNGRIDVATADIAECGHKYHDREAMRECNPRHLSRA
jgi:hypothetical protein